MAVLVFLGVGVSAIPTRLPEALTDYLGSDQAGSLADQVQALLKESFRAGNKIDQLDLAAATRAVEAQMRADHPELSADAIEAIGWNWSWAMR
jgi:hypothetical protein